MIYMIHTFSQWKRIDGRRWYIMYMFDKWRVTKLYKAGIDLIKWDLNKDHAEQIKLSDYGILWILCEKDGINIVVFTVEDI